MKLYFLVLMLLSLVINIAKAQTNSTSIPIDVEKERIHRKVTELEKYVNAKNMNALSSISIDKLKEEINRAKSENKTINNKIRIKINKIEYDQDTARVFCSITVYNSREFLNQLETVLFLEKSIDWHFNNLEQFVEFVNQELHLYTRPVAQATYYNEIQVQLNLDAMVRRPLYNDVYELSPKVTKEELDIVLYSVNARIDCAEYTINPEGPHDIVGLSVDPDWRRIVYGRNTEVKLRTYGDQAGQLEFGRPVAIDANEFGEIFVLDNEQIEIIKLNYSNSDNIISPGFGFIISEGTLFNPTDLDYCSGSKAFDKSDDFIVVADEGKKSILKFDINGNLIKEYKNLVTPGGGDIYEIESPFRLVADDNLICFIDKKQKLVISGYMLDHLPLIELSPEGASKLPTNSNPVDISFNSSGNILVADNYLRMIHIFDYWAKYIYSYNGYLDPNKTIFMNPEIIPNNVINYPGWLSYILYINNRWGADKGIQSFLPAGDVVNLERNEFEHFIEFRYMFTEKMNYRFELIRTTDNSVVKSETDYGLGGQVVQTIIEKSLLTSGNYKWKIFYQPYYDYKYGDYAVGWKSKELLFTYSNAVTLSLNPIICETTEGTYYKNENTGEISTQFQIQAGIPTTIKAYGAENCVFLSWSDGNTDNPRVFNLSENSSGLYATFKALRKSNDEAGYSNNSQRKFLRTNYYPDQPIGTLHNIYKSVGHVWHEASTDNGVTWKILHNGPLDQGSEEAGTPSMVSCNDLRRLLFVTFIKNCSLYVKVMKYGIDNVLDVQTLVGSVGEGATSPVISHFSSSDKIFVIWKDPAGLQYAVANKQSIPNKVADEGDPWIPYEWVITGQVPGTSASSFTPSVAGTSTMHIVWQQKREGYYSDIYYCTASFNPGLTFTASSNISLGNGSINNNYSPTVMEFNGGARVSWVGRVRTTITTRATFRDPAYGQFWNMGGPVVTVSLAPTLDNKYIVGWSQTNGSSYSNKYTSNSSLGSVIRDFYNSGGDLHGKDLQLCNGDNFNYVNANAFEINPGSLHRFVLSNPAVFNKQASGELTKSFSGRQATVYQNQSQFYCTIGDISVDGEKIPFLEMSDTIQVDNLSTLNKYLVTQPFKITDNSNFTLSIDYGITDSLNAISMVKEKNQVSFKVVLVDMESDKVLAELDKVSFNEKKEFKSQCKSYKINTNKIDDKTVVLKVITEADLNSKLQKDMKYSISHLFDEGYVLAKSAVEEVILEESPVPLNYALSQNYPNPFNPVTTINYQLPKDGMVTLKIYDAIGNEITTLVKEYKLTGSYNVQFNASNLASGVYFYKLNVNDPAGGTGFSAVKKLILMK